jgi:hypothetical protein
MVAIAFKNSSSSLSNGIEPRQISSLSGAGRHSDESEREEIALYLAQMTAELAALARGAQYDLLGYFLEMARIEAKGRAGVWRAAN